MNYYLIGIKGVGMTALAQVLKSEGHSVIGSDTNEKFFTDDILNSLDIKYFEEFNEKHINSNIDFVIKSAAYTKENIEVKKVQDLNIKSLEYPEALGEISKNYFSVAVCGTHGKTTQSAMLSVLLQDISLDPLAIIGSQVPQFYNKNARIQNKKNDLFVAETCEYKRHFLNFNPNIILLPSLDFDHVDYFKDTEDYENAFVEFINKLPKNGLLVICGDSVSQYFISKVKEKKINLEIVTYGFEKYNDIKTNKDLKLSVPGKHNILNACGSLVVAEYLWKRKNKEVFPKEKALKSLKNFQNTKRRFEKIGEYKKALIFDDYAHHPEEIIVTLKTCKEIYPDKNIIAVFQSHTFSRTQKLEKEFAKSFKLADQIILAPIYSSARENETKYSSIDFLNVVKKANKNVLYFESYEAITKYLNRNISSKDLVVTMGAGDIWQTVEKFRS